MPRVLSGAMGLFLLLVPLLMVYSVTVPVPEHRRGTYADYQAFVVVCLIVYGGAAVGILVQWRRYANNRRPISAEATFWAACTGGMVAIGIALIAASVEEGPGNLWGLVVIFGGVFSAIVGAGAALLWYALHRPSVVRDTASLP
jgi:hypothetical protein